MLLGWIDGPVEFNSLHENPTDEEQEMLDSLTFSLHDAIEMKGDTLESAYEDAKERNLPDHVVAEKREAVHAFPDEIRLANVYLCAVEDELNKGDASKLRLDRKLSNEVSRYSYMGEEAGRGLDPVGCRNARWQGSLLTQLRISRHSRTFHFDRHR